MGFRILKMANEHDRTGDPALFRRIKGVSAPALLIFVLTTTLRVHRLDHVARAGLVFHHLPLALHGRRSAADLRVHDRAAGAVLQARAVRQLRQDRSIITISAISMLAFTMLWAYMSLAQFLIIWAENLPDEIPWYIRRFSGGWGYIGWFISIFHFCVPFFLLLMRFVKKNPEPPARAGDLDHRRPHAGCILVCGARFPPTRIGSLLDRSGRVDRHGRNLAGLLHFESEEAPAAGAA